MGEKYAARPKPVRSDYDVAKLAFELIGETVTVTNSDDGSEEQRPAIVFNDINIPAAGITTSRSVAPTTDRQPGEPHPEVIVSDSV